MPQLQLIQNGPLEMRDLRITVKPPRTPQDATEVIVAIERGNQTAPFPAWCGALPGVQADFLVTLVTEALSAWAYGEDARDVQRACAAVKKQARAHALKHEF